MNYIRPELFTNSVPDGVLRGLLILIEQSSSRRHYWASVDLSLPRWEGEGGSCQ